MVKKLLKHFKKRELQNTNPIEFRIEKAINKKGGKLHVKWKGYEHSFNIWIDKKEPDSYGYHYIE